MVSQWDRLPYVESVRSTAIQMADWARMIRIVETGVQP